MALNPRHRVTAIDLLQTDYEYCTISYYVEGSRNDFGEPTRVLTQRANNVKCSIDALTRTPAYITRSGLRDMLQQGIVEATVYIMVLSTDQTIEPGDIVTDYAGTIYNTIVVFNWYTHKEAFLRKLS